MQSMVADSSNSKLYKNNFSCSVIVKLQDEFLELHPGLPETAPGILFSGLLAAFPHLCIIRLFVSLPGDKIIALISEASRLDASYRPVALVNYYRIACDPQTDVHQLMAFLRLWEPAALAYTCSGTTSAGAYREQGLVNTQAYLYAAPVGIDAAYAWTMNGGKGGGPVQLINIEQGWNHDDELVNCTTFPLTGINNPKYWRHGTAVLQAIMKKGNTVGSMGITPEASAGIISIWRPDGSPNDADAILAAISYLRAGDIILLEVQSYYHDTQNKLWPVEIQPACFDVIRLANALGILVIEAGGNGDPDSGDGNDLDMLSVNDKLIFNQTVAGYKDSGAIVVAAATANAVHERMRYSNYGSRVNCFAWGEGVEVSGVYPAAGGMPAIPFAQKLNGTSAAAAIVAGAALAVQSICEANYKIRLNPKQMRDVLGNDLYNTPSANGRLYDKIGVMPDLKKIINGCISNFLPGENQ